MSLFFELQDLGKRESRKSFLSSTRDTEMIRQNEYRKMTLILNQYEGQDYKNLVGCPLSGSMVTYFSLS